jgi:hypothetical protein
MTTPNEERIIMTKRDIKTAIDESLSELISNVADIQKKKEPWSGGWLIDIVGKILPVLLVALVSWVAITIVEVQKEIVSMRIQINDVQKDLMEHNDASRAAATANAVVHHTAIVSENKCNSCHVQFFNPANADLARKLKGKPVPHDVPAVIVGPPIKKGEKIGGDEVIVVVPRHKEPDGDETSNTKKK